MENQNDTMFTSKENAVKTFQMIESFVCSYVENKDKMPLRDWLILKLREVKVWGDDAEKIADMVIEAAQLRYKTKHEFEKYIQDGGSEEGYIVKKIEELATERGISANEAKNLLDKMIVSADKRLETESSDEWNDYTKTEQANTISHKAYAQASINIVSQAKIALADKIKGILKREKTPSLQSSMENIIINAGSQASDDVGLNAAITAGYLSAAKSGFVKFLERFESNTQSIPVLGLAASATVAVSHAVALSIDTARIGYKLAMGKISTEEAGQQLRVSATCQNIGSLGLGIKGALIGASTVAIPLIGPAIAPVATVAGGIIGALAGDTVGKYISKGIDIAKQTFGDETVSKINDFAKQTAKKAVDFVSKIGSSLFNFGKKAVTKVLS